MREIGPVALQVAEVDHALVHWRGLAEHPVVDLGQGGVNVRHEVIPPHIHAALGEELGQGLPGLVRLLVHGLGPGYVDRGLVNVQVLAAVHGQLGVLPRLEVDESVVLGLADPLDRPAAAELLEGLPDGLLRGAG